MNVVNIFRKYFTGSKKGICLKIKAVIMCHNKPKTSDALYESLSPCFDVSLFDSGSDSDKIPKHVTHKFGNLYWSGCWNKAIELFGSDCDVLWVIGGDIELRNKPEEYKKAIETACPFGCWSPAIEGSGRPLMLREFSKDIAWQVWHVEGQCMAVSSEIIQYFHPFPKGNKIGWGLDLWMCCCSWENKYRNILDGRVFVFHPASRGYSTEEAFLEMNRWFELYIGKEWRTRFRHVSDDFHDNVISLLSFKPHFPCS